ncbi:MAG: HD domain-containing protein [Lachnospiraceae bacterium]|nr:HD domain-containing protein [Lachnospiraceae bacterium]
MKRLKKLEPDEFKTFTILARPIAGDIRVRQMRNFIQHGRRNTYDHCLSVAYTAFLLNRRLHLNADEEQLVRAALLHDYYLYDWHYKGDKLHGYHHPTIASDNAARDFNLSNTELEMIKSHMWPLTLFHFPTSKGGWLISIADKICSCEEIIA